MWGGRFSSGPDAIMKAINASIEFDQRLAPQDIAGSKAHVAMLAAAGIVSANDAQLIDEGLDTILREVESGTFKTSAELEDIHMNVESRLHELIGDVAGRLHTARSRNDQVATDLRLFVRDAIDGIDLMLASYQKALAVKAFEHCETILPGYTHLQTAQPITFGHHLLAYVEMTARDRGRFADARVRLNECPLGAAALAGTSFPIDRDMTASALDFSQPMANALDAVSARDFALEVLAAAAICATHLSRLAEEIVIWCSAEFSFITLSDKFTTGSSIMPQKRNPDAAELVRAKAGRTIGSLVTLLTVLKGLPMAYGKDMQEDKEAVFDALDTLELSISAMAGMVGDMQPNVKRMRAAANNGHPTATDLADWLVRTLNMPFREAHHITGRIVALADQGEVRLGDIRIDELRDIDPRITEDVLSVLSVESSILSRTSFGGTAPAEVERRAQSWIEKLELDER